MTYPPTGRPASPDGHARTPQDPAPATDPPIPSRPGHPGQPVSTAEGPLAWGSGLAAELAPFVAWLATQDIRESVRRSHRIEAEEFLRWSRSDAGPETGRRRRYDRFLAENHPVRLDGARAGLDRLAEYRAVVASTLPIDHH